MRLHCIYTYFFLTLVACSPSKDIDQDFLATEIKLEILHKQAHQEAALITKRKLAVTEIEQDLINRAKVKQADLENLLMHEDNPQAAEEALLQDAAKAKKNLMSV